MVPFIQPLWQSFSLAGIAVNHPVSLADIQSLKHVVIQAVSGQSFNQAGMLSFIQFLWKSFNHSDMLTFSQFLDSHSIKQTCSNSVNFPDSNAITQTCCHSAIFWTVI
jgi:hypothetical protein